MHRTLNLRVTSSSPRLGMKLSSSFQICEDTQEEATIFRTRKWTLTSHYTESANNVILEFPVCRTVKNKFLFVISHLVCSIFLQQPKWNKTTICRKPTANMNKDETQRSSKIRNKAKVTILAIFIQHINGKSSWSN